MLTQIWDFIARLFPSESRRLSQIEVESEKLKQAERVVAMSLKLVQQYEQRLAEVEAKVDKLETQGTHYQGIIASLERRLKASEEKERHYEIKIAEMKRNYESTIADLEARIVELESKTDQRGTNH